MLSNDAPVNILSVISIRAVSAGMVKKRGVPEENNCHLASQQTTSIICPDLDSNLVIMKYIYGLIEDFNVIY